jgi:hypothetical protein
MLVLVAIRKPTAKKNQTCRVKVPRFRRRRINPHNPTSTVAIPNTYIVDTAGEMRPNSNRAKTKCRLSTSRKTPTRSSSEAVIKHSFSF